MRKAIVRSIGNSFTFEVAETDASVENSRYKEGQKARFESCGELLHEIREFLGVDSIGYLSLEGMLRCVTSGNGHYCNACFSGDYPIPIDPNFHKTAFERGQLRFFETTGEAKRASH